MRDPGAVPVWELEGSQEQRSAAVDSGVKPGTFLQFPGNSYQHLSPTPRSATVW